MHEIEPYYNWREYYIVEEDENLPFFQKEYSEFEFSESIYNYYIHPQWDYIGSKTLYIKILYVNYDDGFAIIEFLGEWNDAIENDIMTLKRNILEVLLDLGVDKQLWIWDNVFNFYYDDDDYYEELSEEIYQNNGWLIIIGAKDYVMDEIKGTALKREFLYTELDQWRIYKPEDIFQLLDTRLKLE